MPLTLIATAGGATSNAYCDAATADAYFLGRAFSDAWTGYTTAQKEQALVFATSLLDRERWKGVKGSTPASGLTQALAWPRRWAPTPEYDADADFIATDFIDTSLAFYSALTIPNPIVKATCELAFEILKAGTTDPFGKAGQPERNVKQKTIDVLTTVYFDLQDRARGLAVFPSVYAEIADLLRGSDAIAFDRA